MSIEITNSPNHRKKENEEIILLLRSLGLPRMPYSMACRVLETFVRYMARCESNDSGAVHETESLHPPQGKNRRRKETLSICKRAVEANWGAIHKAIIEE